MKRVLFVLTMALLAGGIAETQAETPPLEATGFVRVENIDGVWWFISPEGEKFISMGINHVEPHLWLAPYNKEATLKRYGADMVDENGYFNTDGAAAKKWIDQQLVMTRDLNFNTWGRHTHPEIKPSLYEDQIYYLASLQTGPLAGWRERNGEGPRPDVFSVDFYNFLDDRIQNICAAHRQNKTCLGYLYTDVPSWEQRNAKYPAMKYPWLNAILTLGEASPGKWAWVKHLQSRYDSPVEAAQVWGMPISPTYGISWYRMVRQVTWFEPVDAKRADADMKSFMPQIADQWYRLHYELIRKYDPNHLIFGDKNWITWHYPYVLDALAKYVDVVSIQAYGRWADDKKVTDHIFEVTGKPIFNGDGSHGVANEHQQEYGVKGFRTGAENIKEVAALYKETVEQMMATPYVVGWHHCGCLQQWDPAERGDSPKNENGFMDPFENYITEWTDVIRDTNAKVVQLHEKAE
ncbi:hypothetical protein [Pontiella agarivorans]|uniref:Agarase n=1 Tax=Pontiella agarivorans TaxID=3038953 RepID=A0ABU5MY35_9BACT|nr:hypothetical protein [Pontiella agarivorans]MDZ8119087.1 hypothetical protein [Pontiella agarivorans]